MTSELEKAWELLETGDVGRVMRHLRFAAERIPLADLAAVVGRVAEGAGFDDLVAASRKLVEEPGQPQRLYDFGYSCLEHGAAYAAVPALKEAVRLVPGSRAARTELVAAYEDLTRHGEAAAVAETAEAPDWFERYLIAYHRLLNGQLGIARDRFAGLGTPDDERFAWAYARLGLILQRADAAASAGTLDHRDLRGWQFALTGGILCEVSPYGFDQGMTGRFALHQDSHASCLRGLLRLRIALEAAGRKPSAVAVPEERGAQIVGAAAALALGVPAVPYEAGREDTVVVAYRLDDLDADTVVSLRRRAPGQVLYEHASCWTEPPPVAADVLGLLRQTGAAPWEKQLTADPAGSEPDDRPPADIAADILAADPAPDRGDDGPADTDEDFAAFVSAVAGRWLGGATRDQMNSPGPVPSSRFL